MNQNWGKFSFNLLMINLIKICEIQFSLVNDLIYRPLYMVQFTGVFKEHKALKVGDYRQKYSMYFNNIWSI